MQPLRDAIAWQYSLFCLLNGTVVQRYYCPPIQRAICIAIVRRQFASTEQQSDQQENTQYLCCCTKHYSRHDATVQRRPHDTVIVPSLITSWRNLLAMKLACILLQSHTRVVITDPPILRCCQWVDPLANISGLLANGLDLVNRSTHWPMG